MDFFRRFFSRARAGARRLLGSRERQDLLEAGIYLIRLSTDPEITDGELEAAKAKALASLDAARSAAEAL